MEESMQAANEGMESPVESAPTEEATVEETDAVSEDETSYEENTSEESAEGDVNVPLHENPRFKEVYSEMKTYKEELAQLKEQLNQQAPVQEYAPQTQAPQYPDWVFNEDGEIIPEEFIRYSDLRSAQVAEQTLQRRENEQRIWGETFKEYPQLKEDSEMKQLIEDGVLAEFQRTGKFIHPKDYAGRFFKRFAEAKQQGAKIAQENSKVVDAAYLESNSPASNRSHTLTNADLAKATPEQIQKWEDNGDLDRALKAGTLKGTPLA